ncbi:MAG: iron-containing alcohol dehydrogenase [Acidobacteria bacterium]|nr:iron-containing alcohol dehydrogenase [Acidobacteriota bacterium]
MNPGHSVEINLSARKHSYDVLISHDVLAETAQWIKRSVTLAPKKITIVSNEKVFGLYGSAVEKSLNLAGFKVSRFLMKDGEEFKNFDSLRDLLTVLGENNLGRTDCVIALGGGVVGDLAGFASAIYLRGIRFLQIPTTLLSMIDSSVGGKTGINDHIGKNLLGAFHQPHGVLIDVSTLKTLESRELAAGFCEMIKHGALAGGNLFSQTAEFLGENRIESFPALFENEQFVDGLKTLVSANVDFKSEIVAGDEF